MQLGPSFDKVVRIAGTVVAVLFVAGAGYLLVRGVQTSTETIQDERGFLPTIEKIFNPEPSPAPTEPKTTTPPSSPKTAANCSVSSFTADPEAIAPGGTSTLRWSTDAASAIISNIGAVEPSGLRIVSPSSRTKYILTATCSNGARVEKGLAVDVAIVTGVSVDVDNDNYAGACPHTFNFTGTIIVNSPTTVSYEWFRDGAGQGAQTLNFAAAGSQNVTHPWSIGTAGSHNVKLKVTFPNERGNSATVNLTCY